MRSWSARSVRAGALVVALAFGEIAAVASAPARPVRAAPPVGLVEPLTPCRLLDTRPGDDNVGGRTTPLGPGEVLVVSVRGEASCGLAGDITGLVVNVTVVNPTAASYLTLWPGEQQRPLASTLNWLAGDAPRANGATVAVDDWLRVYNHAGTVDLVLDVVAQIRPAGAYVVTVDRPHPVADVGARLTPAELAQRRWDADRNRAHVVPLSAGASLVTFDGHAVWAAGGSVLRRIDPVTEAVTAELTMAGSVMALASDGTSVWVGTQIDGMFADRLTKIDGASAAVVGSVASPLVRGIVADVTRTWVLGGGGLTELDAVTLAPVRTIAVGFLPIALESDGRALWAITSAAEGRDLRLWRIDPGNGAVTAIASDRTFQIGALAFDGADMWALVSAMSDPPYGPVLTQTGLLRIDPVTGAVTATSVSTDDPAWALVYDGTDLWAAGDAHLRRIDPASGRVELVVDRPATSAGRTRSAVFDGATTWMAVEGLAGLVRGTG